MKFLRRRSLQLSIVTIVLLLIGTVVLAWHAAAPSLDSTEAGAQSEAQMDALTVKSADVLSLGEDSSSQALQRQGITTVQAPNTLQTQPAPSPQTAGDVPATRSFISD